MNSSTIKGILASTLFAVVALTGCDKPATVASIGDAEITSAQLSAYLKHKRIPEQDATVVERALDDLISREALAQAIEQQDVLDAELIAAEQAEVRRQMLIGRYFEKFLAERITDDMVRAFYANNAADYESNRVKVAHILIRTNTQMGEAERQAKLTLAREVYSQLTSGGDFITLAKAYSEDKVSAQKGGELGWIAEGAVNPEFSNTAFALQPGAYSEPMMTSFGFHIIKQLEAPQKSRQPLEAVQSQIKYRLQKEAKQAEMERLLASVEQSKNYPLTAE
ncbi:peptidylprolyl isomerase [Corallincola holothuriorum]|uniref:peptidylprolyl isomerase n=1 Tax=Corallincola holothuriorum TaxID=2282215 RepID=A0A368NSF9_9GAMM|nr:peptidylprolyl isomerase [Corallincola holothuriorum]RCU52634.1 peptidylprolyl isomerase [Corallincola holothuriorum]